MKFNHVLLKNLRGSRTLENVVEGLNIEAKKKGVEKKFSPSKLWYLENGKRKPDYFSLVVLASYFDKTVEYFYMEEK